MSYYGYGAETNYAQNGYDISHGYLSQESTEIVIDSEPEMELEVNINELFDNMVLLGSGQFGDVFKGTTKKKTKSIDINIEVAIKTIKINELDRSGKLNKNPSNKEKAIERQLFEIKKEALLLKKIYQQCKSIVRVYYFTDKVKSYDLVIVMELISGKSLEKTASKLTGNEFKKNMNKWTLELFNAVECLNRNKFYHKDIKGDNIMIDSHNSLKLIDFGLACSVKDKMFSCDNDKIAYVYFRYPIYLYKSSFLSQLIIDKENIKKEENKEKFRKYVDKVLNKMMHKNEDYQRLDKWAAALTILKLLNNDKFPEEIKSGSRQLVKYGNAKARTGWTGDSLDKYEKDESVKTWMKQFNPDNKKINKLEKTDYKQTLEPLLDIGKNKKYIELIKTYLNSENQNKVLDALLITDKDKEFIFSKH